MLKRRPKHGTVALLAALCALCTTTHAFVQLNAPRDNVLSDALLASPPGSTPSVETEDLFDGPLMTCTLRGLIENAQCNYEQVDAINKDFYNHLQSIVTAPYFRYFKTDLDKTCPFWPDDSFCTEPSCAVQTLDKSDVPEKYRITTLSSVLTTPDEVVANVSGGTGASSCQCDETDFCHWDDEYSSDAVFVDLHNNPERFTGYGGPSAARIWKSIYDENCFGVPGKALGIPARLSSASGIGMSSDMSINPAASQAFASFLSSMRTDQGMNLPEEEDDGSTCLEKRVFYRIVSGLHASISIHICDEYLDKETGQWGPNEQCFRSRIANFPERLQNLYFDYVLFLRALARIGEQTASQPNFTITSVGNEIDDQASREQFGQLLMSATKLKPTFDERTMFAGPDAAGLREEFQHRFRNITSIMDCVGCDKCRLWGKLQTSGLATALKVLFTHDEQDRSEGGSRSLKRSELVALVNTAHRLAESLNTVERFRTLYQQALGMGPTVANRSIIGTPGSAGPGPSSSLPLQPRTSTVPTTNIAPEEDTWSPALVQPDIDALGSTTPSNRTPIGTGTATAASSPPETARNDLIAHEDL